MQCNFPTLASSSSSLNHCAHGTEPVRARKQAVQSVPAFEETSLNANPHIFLSVCSFLLIDMGLIGNEAKEETDCALSYGQVCYGIYCINTRWDMLCH